MLLEPIWGRYPFRPLPFLSVLFALRLTSRLSFPPWAYGFTNLPFTSSGRYFTGIEPFSNTASWKRPN